MFMRKMLIVTTLSCCLLVGTNYSLAFAANADNPNLEYIRMGMDLSDQINSKLAEGNFSNEDTLTAEIESQIAPGKKQVEDSKTGQVEFDEFATDANNSNINLFLTEIRDYSVNGTSGELRGYKNEGMVYLTRLTAATTILEASDVVAAREKAKEIAEDIRSETDSKQEMVRLVNEYLAENTTYIKNYNTETQKWLWSNTGPLLHGEAVCMGYAYAFKSILDQLGIPAQTLIGESKSGINHAWSRCRIDGTWYYCDVTYNDPLGGKPTEDYLLLSKSAFYKKIGHKPIYDPDERVADNAYHVVYRNDQDYEANVLNKQSLFMGDDRGFRLEDELTRIEMAVLLTRMVGGTKEIASNSELYVSQCKFTDVPDWAKKYVGYCVTKGLIKGVGNNLFGTNNQATKLDFCTVILRATGVTEGYRHSTADEKAVELGYINEGRTAYKDLNRADVVHILYNVHMLEKI
ncbi:S-layer homology domain-containing protein [Clostridium aminobutyricum]|uniref:S-layer homology domain-containing protein n=1 Tax=Clostridium aminobutyricum TaxID=33953 RepID=A0A939DA41_CLOAM|nr:S-layer homology domain-containing protein [Clostridium aminobutyricum]MBN7774189.1 S-layer homology domain-containing protein [Clostridium aminobutyricum]